MIEKVIKRLEYCVENKCDICQEKNGSEFPWIDGRCYGFTERLYDALTLLKAQEPRVMTLEELDSHKVGEPLFYESRIVYPCWVIHLNSKTTDRIHFIGAVGNIYKAKEEYCVYWRCWTSRPTDEQREAVKWDG